MAWEVLARIWASTCSACRTRSCFCGRGSASTPCIACNSCCRSGSNPGGNGDACNGLHVVLDVRFEVTEFGEVRKILACGVAQWFLEVIQVRLEHGCSPACSRSRSLRSLTWGNPCGGGENMLGLAITSQAKTQQHIQDQYYFQRPLKEQTMAKRCDICGKGPRYGHTISHAHNLTNRRWNPNLQRMRVQTSGGAKRIKICTRCLRSGKVQKAS